MTASVVAVCSSGGIGDLLAATPAMRSLARHFDAPLTVLASPYAAPVIQDQPFVSDTMLDDGSQSARELGDRLAQSGFTHAVVFWSTARIASALRRAGIPTRVGQARRLYSWQYTRRVPVRTETGDTHSHWTDVQLDYARALGAVPQPSDIFIDVRLRAVDIDEADRVVSAHGLSDGFIVLHAARGIRLDRVRWPVQSFAAIGDALAGAYELPVVLTGAPADAPAIAEIAAAMTARTETVAGETTLTGLAALLARSTLTVALDSGPMHIAAALGVPTVGIFALRTDLPDRWRPLGPRVAIVRPSYPCPPWHRKETCRTFECYAALSPATVLEAARSIARPSAEPAARTP